MFFGYVHPSKTNGVIYVSKRTESAEKLRGRKYFSRNVFFRFSPALFP
jgi:hypothetical protein